MAFPVITISTLHPEDVSDECAEYFADYFGYVPDDWEQIWAEVSAKTPRLSAKNDKHVAAILAARRAAKAAGWPELTGSTKQKWWAVQIRQTLFPQLSEDIRDHAIETITAAKVWIDNRDNGQAIATLARQARAEHEARLAEHRALLSAEKAHNSKLIADFQAAHPGIKIDREAMLLRAPHRLAQDLENLASQATAGHELAPVFSAHSHLLKPFAGQPGGRKIADFDTSQGRVRAFKNMGTGAVQFLLDTPAGKQAFALASV